MTQRLTSIVLSSVRYIPSWFPGTGWKETAAAWRQDLFNLVNVPHQFVLDQLVSSTKGSTPFVCSNPQCQYPIKAAGTAVPSYTSDLLEDGKVDHDMVKWSAMTIYAAGADTVCISGCLKFEPKPPLTQLRGVLE